MQSELLRKAISDLGIVDRTRGVNSPEAIAMRANLEGLYKSETARLEALTKAAKGDKKDGDKDKEKDGDNDEDDDED